MKHLKLFSLIALMFTFAVITHQAQAQTNQFTTGYRMPLATGDTAVNTTAVNKIFTATAGYNSVTVSPIITKISGTVAGKAYLYESLDGTNYEKIDSLTLANQTTNFKIFRRTNTQVVYYKVNVVGTGTMAAQVRVWYLLRKNIAQ